MTGKNRRGRTAPPVESGSSAAPAHEERQVETAPSVEDSTPTTAMPANLSSMTSEELEQRARELEAELRRKALIRQVATLQAQVNQESRTQNATQGRELSLPNTDEDDRRGRSRERHSSDSSASDEQRERKRSRYVDAIKPELYRGKSKRELTEFTRACELQFEAKPKRYTTDAQGERGTEERERKFLLLLLRSNSRGESDLRVRCAHTAQSRNPRGGGRSAIYYRA